MPCGRCAPLFSTQRNARWTFIHNRAWRQGRSSVLSWINPWINPNHYNFHSFRIGAATSATQANIPDSYIKMLGHWQSNCYQRYIKTPPQELAKFSAILTTPPNQQPTSLKIPPTKLQKHGK